VQGVDAHVWLNNGGGVALNDSLRSLAVGASRPVFLFSASSRLPIARSHNQCLRVASEKWQDADYLVLQDDVIPAVDSAVKLAASAYDIPGGFSRTRPESTRNRQRFGFRVIALAQMLIRNRVFKDLGYHDELFWRGVDSEYCVRAGIAGFSVGFEDGVYFDNAGRHGHAEANTTDAERMYEHSRAQLIWMKKNGLLDLPFREPLKYQNRRPVVFTEPEAIA